MVGVCLVRVGGGGAAVAGVADAIVVDVGRVVGYGRAEVGAVGDVIPVDIGGVGVVAAGEYVGVCAFTAGRAGAQCDGPVALATEAGGAGVGSLERRFLGRWVRMSTAPWRVSPSSGVVARAAGEGDGGDGAGGG